MMGQAARVHSSRVSCSLRTSREDVWLSRQWSGCLGSGGMLLCCWAVHCIRTELRCKVVMEATR